MRIELLYFDGCPSYEALLPALRETLTCAGVEDEVELRRVESIEDVECERFLGSPTVRIDGRDIEASAERRRDYGMKCRLYRTSAEASGVPPEGWITAAIDAAQARGGRSASASTRS